MWEFFFCLMPSMFLFTIARLFQSKWIYHLVEEGTRQLTLHIWIIICSILKLPHPSVLYGTGDKESKIKLIYKSIALANNIIQNCKALACAPPARWPKADPHLQMFFNFIWPIEDDAQEHCGITFTRDHLLIQDGGIVALDWAVRLKDLNAQAKREHYLGERAPGYHTCTPSIIILIPNALGKITQNLLSLCRLALQQGFYTVVFHRRGHGRCLLTTPRYQEFGDPSDLVQAVLYIKSRHPSSDLFAINEGSGSGLMLSYLGERGSSSHLVAAACISPVFYGQLFFETPCPKLYNEASLFYRKLQMSSTDDPIMPPASTLPMSIFQNSPYFFLALTSQGSHCGFLQQDTQIAASWSHEAVLEYFWVV